MLAGLLHFGSVALQTSPLIAEQVFFVASHIEPGANMRLVFDRKRNNRTNVDIPASQVLSGLQAHDCLPAGQQMPGKSSSGLMNDAWLLILSGSAAASMCSRNLALLPSFLTSVFFSQVSGHGLGHVIWNDAVGYITCPSTAIKSFDNRPSYFKTARDDTTDGGLTREKPPTNTQQTGTHRFALWQRRQSLRKSSSSHRCRTSTSTSAVDRRSARPLRASARGRRRRRRANEKAEKFRTQTRA